jgi:type I restriction enzyme S subunit
MKPSGIPWIGNIPHNWEIKKIKYVSTLKGRIGWQGLTSDEYTDEGAYLITGTDFDNGSVNWEKCVCVPMKRWEEAKDIQIENGDLLITKDGTIGKVVIVSGLNNPCSLNSGVLRILTINGYDRRFLFWVLQSEVFWTWFSNKNAGNSTILHLYQGDFAEFIYAIPPLPEQQSIAAFLDNRCEQIDGIIADLERQIEILQKYKKAVITETVTKGLNKDVAMKDSGIDWIGEIPQKWMLKRFKYFTESANTGEAISKEYWNVDGSFLLYTAGQVPIRTTYDLFPKYLLTTDNDILVARNGAGAVNLPENGSIYTDHVIRFVLKNNVNREFLYYALLLGIDKIVAEAIDVSLKTLSRSNWDNLHIPMIPISEQQAIVDYLNDKCIKTNAIISEKQRSIDTMRQYKKSLIYEYVTGKKRVSQ